MATDYSYGYDPAALQKQIAAAQKASSGAQGNSQALYDAERAAATKLQTQNAGMGFSYNPIYQQAYDQAHAQANAARSQQAQADASLASLQAQDPTTNPGAAGQRLFGLGEGFRNEQYTNPIDQMLMEQLTQRVSGNAVPYNAETINALKTGQNEMGAAAEANRNATAMASLEDRGFKPGDPAYQAALARNQLSRQQGNQSAALNISQQANLANYNARGQAMSQMAAQNENQQARRAAATSNLINLYGKVGNTTTEQRQLRMPTYQQYIGG